MLLLPSGVRARLMTPVGVQPRNSWKLRQVLYHGRAWRAIGERGGMEGWLAARGVAGAVRVLRLNFS